MSGEMSEANPYEGGEHKRFHELDVLRGVAAVGVVLFHYITRYDQLYPRRGDVAFDFEIGSSGPLLFFVISGFVIFMTLSRCTVVSDFTVSRFSRLYPVYAFSLLLSAGMLMLEVQAHTKLDFGLGVVLTPLLLQGWHPALSTFWNTPAWTMSTEAFFYLLFPFLITRRRPRQARTILAILFAVWLSALVLPALYMHFNPDGDAHPDRYSVGIWMRALKFMPLQHLPSFLFGMGLGFLNEKIRPESRKRLVIGLLAFAALYLILCVGDRLPYVMMHDGLLMPLFAGVILCLAGQNPIARFFGLLPFIAIGEASYCLYLLHFNLWTLLHDSHFLEKSGLIVFDPWISYLFLIVAALLTKRLIERPGRNWISRRLQPAPAQ